MTDRCPQAPGCRDRCERLWIASRGGRLVARRWMRGSLLQRRASPGLRLPAAFAPAPLATWSIAPAGRTGGHCPHILRHTAHEETAAIARAPCEPSHRRHTSSITDVHSDEATHRLVVDRLIHQV